MFFHSNPNSPQCGAMPGPGGLLAVCLVVALIAVVGTAMRIGGRGGRGACRTWGPF